LNILEERINVKTQMEYFNLSKSLKKEINKDDIISRKDEIFNQELSLNEKKILLASMASIENIELYRTLEKFVKTKDKKLYEWGILAMQECRMLLESSLLDENQVFISTGLGGKNNKLRYFIVIISNSNTELDDVKKRIIESELDFSLKNHNAELEKITFNEKYAAIVCLLPINLTISEIIKGIIDECNKMGNFLEKNYLITNVQEFAIDEIDNLIKQATENKNQKQH
jgi:hypothetical protein